MAITDRTKERNVPSKNRRIEIIQRDIQWVVQDLQALLHYVREGNKEDAEDVLDAASTTVYRLRSSIEELENQ